MSDSVSTSTLSVKGLASFESSLEAKGDIVGEKSIVVGADATASGTVTGEHLVAVGWANGGGDLKVNGGVEVKGEIKVEGGIEGKEGKVRWAVRAAGR